MITTANHAHIFQKEILRRYHTLILFDCGKRVMEKEWRFSLVDRWEKPVHITLKDTVVHPDKWADAKLIVEIKISGDERKPDKSELTKDGFAAMFFGDHAYLRSCDREGAISVSLPAPDGAYIKLISGKEVYPTDGSLNFTVNTAWFDESPTLYGYPKNEFEEAIKSAKVKYIGKTACSRWSGQ